MTGPTIKSELYFAVVEAQLAELVERRDRATVEASLLDAMVAQLTSMRAHVVAGLSSPKAPEAPPEPSAGVKAPAATPGRPRPRKVQKAKGRGYAEP